MNDTTETNKERDFDKLLTAALLQAAELDYCSGIPNDGEYSMPSKRFLRRIRKVIRNPKAYLRRLNAPIYIRVLKTAAMLLLTMSMLIGIAMLHPTARAKVQDLISIWLPDRTVYRQTHQTGEDVPSEWIIGYIPDGFELDTLDADPLNYYCLYVSESGRILLINILGDSGSLYVDNEHHKIYQIYINDEVADAYEALDELSANQIVWFNNENRVIINIIGDIVIDELILVAESIELLQ